MKKLLKDKTALATLVIVAIVIIVVAVVGVAAYYLLTQNAGTPEETPTPTPTAPDVAGASSLQYSVTLTEGGTETGAYTYYGKDAGTDNFALRIEYNDADGEGIFIFNGATDEAWTYAGGQWTDISDYFDMQFDVWDNLWSGYVTGLANWAGTGDHTYTSGDATVTISGIQVNPTLADSLFTHSE